MRSLCTVQMLALRHSGETLAKQDPGMLTTTPRLCSSFSATLAGSTNKSSTTSCILVNFNCAGTESDTTTVKVPTNACHAARSRRDRSMAIGVEHQGACPWHKGVHTHTHSQTPMPRVPQRE